MVAVRDGAQKQWQARRRVWIPEVLRKQNDWIWYLAGHGG